MGVHSITIAEIGIEFDDEMSVDGKRRICRDMSWPETCVNPYAREWIIEGVYLVE